MLASCHLAKERKKQESSAESLFPSSICSISVIFLFGGIRESRHSLRGQVSRASESTGLTGDLRTLPFNHTMSPRQSIPHGQLYSHCLQALLHFSSVLAFSSTLFLGLARHICDLSKHLFMMVWDGTCYTFKISSWDKEANRTCFCQ